MSNSSGSKGPDYVGAGAILEDTEMFDASFFGVPAREARITDPQHRMFLECSWEAFESAGYDPSRVGESAGVFAGTGPASYLHANLMANPTVLRETSALELELGNERDYLPMRVSHRLGLCGPSMAVQTACSTSLVAVHVACESLLAGECDVALAGGASLRLPQGVGYLYEAGSLFAGQRRVPLSPDGHCRAFDADAGGTVLGSGVGVVLLKRLSDALRDRDTIHAVVRGSAVNNDGASKVGFTAPGLRGQAAVVAEAIEVAGIDPATIGHIETNATGTILGDAVEVQALREAFATSAIGAPGGGLAGGAERRCAIGTIKTNLGHTGAAAGIAGLIKSVLALQHRKLPPTLNFRRPNPRIPFEETPFHVNSELAEWGDLGVPRRAGVSSFAIGGTNCHVLLEEAPATARQAARRPASSCRDEPPQLLLMSARSSDELTAVRRALVRWLQARPDTPLEDVAHTLRLGRRAFEHRCAVICGDCCEATAALAGHPPSGVHIIEARSDRPDDAPRAAGPLQDGSLGALAESWVSGCEVDSSELDERPGRRVTLPTYPFRRQRHWVDAAELVAPLEDVRQAAGATRR